MSLQTAFPSTTPPCRPHATILIQDWEGAQGWTRVPLGRGKGQRWTVITFRPQGGLQPRAPSYELPHSRMFPRADLSPDLSFPKYG